MSNCYPSYIISLPISLAETLLVYYFILSYFANLGSWQDCNKALLISSRRGDFFKSWNQFIHTFWELILFVLFLLFLVFFLKMGVWTFTFTSISTGRVKLYLNRGFFYYFWGESTTTGNRLSRWGKHLYQLSLVHSQFCQFSLTHLCKL